MNRNPAFDIEVRSLTRRIGGRTILDSVQLAIQQGEFFSLLGPSGCGKTTLLRCVAGFDQPDIGSIHLGGDDVTRLPPQRRDLNMVFQSYALFPHLSVFENVAFGLKLAKASRLVDRVDEALKQVRLDGFDRRAISSLSGGEQQRVALARAIVMRPKALLLDEPLGALDLALRRGLQEELKALQRELNMTFIYVTHDQDEALSMSDRVAVMNHGRVEQVGTPKEIYDRPRTEFVARFVGTANIMRMDGRTYLIRPEHVRLNRPDGNLAVVERLAYLGGRTLVTVNVMGQRLIAESRADSSDGALTVGQSTRVTWDLKDAHLIGGTES